MSNLVIATNVAGLNSHRSLKVISQRSEKASEKLSSGFRINRAADDAAGLAISEKMRNQIAGLNQANRNTADGVSLVQIADAGMNEIAEMIKRQRELIIQGMNDTNASEDREKIHMELNQLSEEITSSANKCEFNTLPLLNTGGSPVSNRIFGAPGIITNSYVWNNNTKHADLHGTAAANSATPAGTIKTLVGEGFSLGNLASSGNTAMMLTAPNGTVIVAGGGTIDVTWPDGSSVYGATAVSDPDGVGEISIGGGYLSIRDIARAGEFSIEIVNNTASPEEIYLCFLPDNSEGLWIQSGANKAQGVWLDRYDCRARTLGIENLVTEPIADAEDSLSRLDYALEIINANRANAGAQQNRLEHTTKALGVSSENLSGAESRIRDTDMAKEMMEFTKSNILSQAGMSMLAQANQSPNRVLTIIR